MADDPGPPTYGEVMTAFRVMDAACQRVLDGSGSEAEYQEAFAAYQAAALAYPGGLIMRGEGDA